MCFGFVRAHRHRLVIVDEAFADMRQDLSMVGAAGIEPNLVVMRSFGKFFGLAGLRLGFVFAEAGLAKILSDRLGPWAVSGPSLAIAAHAFSRLDLINEIRGKLDKAHMMTRSALKMARAQIVGEPRCSSIARWETVPRFATCLPATRFWCVPLITARRGSASDWRRTSFPQSGFAKPCG
jgi:aspartate/methionine/tyrosine aminotransferase